jgi:hypothetical protein
VYFWQALPDLLHSIGILFLALAGIHGISAIASKGNWLAALLTAAAHFLKKSAKSIRDFIQDTWGDLKNDPGNTGFGCLVFVVFALFLAGIVSVFTGGALGAFFNSMDFFLERLVKFAPADEIFLVLLVLLSPLLVLFFLLLVGVVWATLALAGTGLGAYARLISNPTPQKRQGIAALFLIVAGTGLLISGGWITPYANNQAKEILKARLASGNLHRLDLQNLNLSGINLAGADLSGANLSGACLAGANLQKANLQNTNLSGAWLDYADLSHAKLRKADLQSASLKYAVLENASFWEANLKGADLRYASSWGIGPSRATLPDGEQTFIGGDVWGYLRFERFTDPEHPKFWMPANLTIPVSCQNALDY